MVKRTVRRRGPLKRLALAASLAALSLAAIALPAAASVTVGQLAPGTAAEICSNGAAIDVLQETVTSGPSFAVPATVATGTLTSWSFNAGASAGRSLTMKVYRKLGDPRIYEALAHDGPRPLTPSTVNTFGGLNIPVSAGDLIGMNKQTGPNACAFAVAAENGMFNREGPGLADGASDQFPTPNLGARLNLSAVITPTSTFTLGATTRNKKKGTATVTATVPNPGELTASGKGVKSAGATSAVSVSAPGTVQLRIRAKGKKKRALNETGKVKLKPNITYTPTGGDPSTQSRKLKLKKNL